MLIVKDFTKLKEHGFIKNNFISRITPTAPLWEKKIGEQGGTGDIYLTVNPYGISHRMNEMILWAYSEDSEGADVTADIDIIFEMIADGTVEYVKKEM